MGHPTGGSAIRTTPVMAAAALGKFLCLGLPDYSERSRVLDLMRSLNNQPQDAKLMKEAFGPLLQKFLNPHASDGMKSNLELERDWKLALLNHPEVLNNIPKNERSAVAEEYQKIPGVVRKHIEVQMKKAQAEWEKDFEDLPGDALASAPVDSSKPDSLRTDMPQAWQLQPAQAIMLSGKNLVFTGELQSMTRAQAAEKAKALGAKVAGSISKNTDYVIVGQAAGSKLAKAQTLNIAQLSETEFLKLIGKTWQPVEKKGS